MTDSIKFLVNEYVTLEVCCSRNNEMMEISQSHGLGMDAWAL